MNCKNYFRDFDLDVKELSDLIDEIQGKQEVNVPKSADELCQEAIVDTEN